MFSLFKTTPILCLILSISTLAAEQTPDKKITYKKVAKTELKLHAFFPKGHNLKGKPPAIVFFFGGGWNGGSPKQFYPQCKHLAKLGIVAFSAEYRVKKSHGTAPKECVTDGKSAMRWLRTNAASIGFSTSRNTTRPSQRPLNFSPPLATSKLRSKR